MTFLEKYELLKKSVPVPAVFSTNSFDSEFVDTVVDCKNCYYCFDTYFLENAMYTSFGAYNKMLVDCHGMVNSEKCYESFDGTKCYNSTFLMDSNSSNDCHYSSYLTTCSNCFGCVGLTHKKYCIFNKQYTKEEYIKREADLKKEGPEKMLKQMFELKQKIPHPASQQFNSENCPYGNYIFDSKNCYWGFLVNYSENSGYLYNSGTMKNCWDMFFSGGNFNQKFYAERCYEQMNTGFCYNCAFLASSQNCSNCYYGEMLRNCSDCFGCVGLSNKKYCILNNQLTKDQYEKAVKEIRIELGWGF